METHGKSGEIVEHISVLDDPASGLSGAIVVHSTALGPAAGGCRLWHYATPNAAHEDAMRLAKGMAYKNAIAGLPLGGGKAVLRLPQGPFDREKLFLAFGKAVEKLGGKYVTAEDVGTSVADMERVARATRHVAGLTQKPGQAGGDPSPWTAQGVYEAMAVASERRLDKPLSECRVAIQGLGNVGSALAQMLFDTGATLVVADPFVSLAVRSSAWYNAAQVVSSETIMTAEVDIFAPCALGGALNALSISTLRAKVVCGAANNQLATEADGVLLSNRGVLYAPDYVVNAGGIINVAAEYLGWSESEVLVQVGKIAPRLTDVFNAADDWGISTKEAADRIARKTIADGEKFSKGLSGISSAVEFRERS